MKIAVLVFAWMFVLAGSAVAETLITFDPSGASRNSIGGNGLLMTWPLHGSARASLAASAIMAAASTTIVFVIFINSTSSPYFILGGNAENDPVMQPGGWQ